MNFKVTAATILFLLWTAVGFSQQQQKLIDSLEQYTPKSSWDELDMAIGLFRMYLFSNQVEEADAQLAKVFALKNEIPIAEGYGLILENIRAYTEEGDDDKAIAKCLEAIEVAKKLGDKNVLAYARYQLAENYEFEKGDTEAALALTLQTIEDLDESVTLKTQGNTYKMLGYAYGRLGEFNKSHEAFDRSKEFFKELISNPPIDQRIGRRSAQDVAAEMHLANALSYEGTFYLNEGKPDLAIQTKLEGLSLVESVDNRDEMAWLNNEIGILYSRIGKFQEAVSHLQTARIVFEEMQLEKDIVRCNNALIGVLTSLGDYEVANKYLKQNIDYYSSKNDSLFLASSFMQGFDLKIAEDNVEEAKAYLVRAETLISSLNNETRKGSLKSMKGTLALKEGSFEEAISYYRSALAVFYPLDDKQNINQNEHNLARVFLTDSSHDSAVVHAQRSLIGSKVQNDLDLIRDNYGLLSEIFEANGDYELAFKNHQTFFNFYDSVNTADAQQKLKNEQVRQNVYEFKEDKEIAEQNALELAQRNRTYLVLGIALLGVMLLGTYFYFSMRKVKSRIETQNLQLEQLNQTKDKFFGIIAHDLRSPLLGLESVGEQIDFLTKKNEPEKLHELSSQIDNTTKKLTELLDNLLNWALLQNGMIPYHPEQINLKEESKTVVGLLSPLADLKGIAIVNKIDDDVLVYADTKSVSTILRNIVSNALKFTHRDGEVTLSVAAQKNRVEVMINDTGTGISAEQLPELFALEKETSRGTMGEKGTGLGLVLCKELVELNKGTIKAMSNLGKGSSFVFNLPAFA